ncbi:MAG: SDR family oxidoreductase [Thermoleophilia bacterium]|nr:SDR family oxidoreductase [Thermoleophilia bacterium]
MRLKNKVAVIAGAGSSMGRAITDMFAREGARVLAVAMGRKRLDELAQRAADYGGEIVPFVGDMTVKADIEGMIDEAVKLFGRVDILVYNAGLMDDYSPVGEFDDEMFDKVLKLNLIAPAYAMRRVIREFEKQGGGVIINVASVAGLFGCRAGAAYTAAKHGLIGLTRNTAYMYANKNIRCNAICPGSITREVDSQEFVDRLNETGKAIAQKGMSLVDRPGECEEIADVAVFLASDSASYINGQALVVDGGWTCY